MITKTIAAAVLCLGFVATPASAQDFQIPPLDIPADAELTVQDETVRSECGDCHMVFPPSRLTQNGWRKIMGDLENHFGENAVLGEATRKHIEDYLVENAMDRKLTYPVKLRLQSWEKKGIIDPIRITELPEWTRHHTSKKKYKLMAEAVGYDGGSNCIKCHLHAEKGYFEEFPGLFGMH